MKVFMEGLDTFKILELTKKIGEYPLFRGKKVGHSSHCVAVRCVDGCVFIADYNPQHLTSAWEVKEVGG